jgi:hypothetical protein
LSQQKVGPFKILQIVGRLAYKIDLPSTWKIHPVISIAHLERHHPDPYDRQLAPLPDIIQDTDEDSPHEEWEIEDVLRSRVTGKNKRKEWRIKWKGFGSEHNTWEPLENLSNAADKIQEFEQRQSPVLVATTWILPSVDSHPPIPFYTTNIHFGDTRP